MSDTYQTITSEVSQILYKKKGSKFIGYAFPVQNLEEVQQHIEQLKKEHPKARHYCYAYQIGIGNKKLYRANDDGEPYGTAGLPINNQITSHDLTNVLVVSVRYFGGTKLGVSGLIEAYKTNARDTLDACQTIEKHIECTVLIDFKYEQLSSIMNLCNQYHATFIHQQFEENCRLEVQIRQSSIRVFTETLGLMKNVQVKII